MNTDAVLAEAERLGIRLFAKEGGRLGYDAPIGTLSPELKAALGAEKEAILARLAGSEARSVPEAEVPWPRKLPWRATIGSWPIELRQRWGDRANALQDGRLEWHEAERVAFEEVEREVEQLGNENRSGADRGRGRQSFPHPRLGGG